MTCSRLGTCPKMGRGSTTAVKSIVSQCDQRRISRPQDSFSAQGNRACDSVFLAERSTRSISDTCSWRSVAARSAGSITCGSSPPALRRTRRPNRSRRAISGPRCSSLRLPAIRSSRSIRMELAREGRSFTVDTLRQLHAEDAVARALFSDRGRLAGRSSALADSGRNCGAGDDRRRQPGGPADARAGGPAQPTR